MILSEDDRTWPERVSSTRTRYKLMVMKIIGFRSKLARLDIFYIGEKLIST